jgi:lysophospholipase L1-like esterase
LEQKANQSNVDTQIAAVASGSPKGTYATLTDLQTAFPSGTIGTYIVVADGKLYGWINSAWSAIVQYQSTGIAVDSVTKDMLKVKFNGLDVKFATETKVLEDKTETARADSLTYPLPTTTGIKDIFIKFTLPASIATAGSFLLLKNSFSYPVGVTGVSGSTCAVSYHGVTTGADILPYSQQYYLRAYNDGTNTAIQVFDMSGNRVQNYSIAEVLSITSLRFLTSTGVLCYDVVVFDGLLTDDMIGEYFFGKTRDLYVDSLLNNGRTFNFKTTAKNVKLESGLTVEDKMASIDSLLSKSKLAGKKSVHFGDSITGNYNPPEDYPSYVANITGLNALNVGVGGTRMAYDGTYTTYDAFCMVKIVDALVANDWTTQDSARTGLTIQGKAQADKLKTVNLATTDLITIWFGTNDYTGSKGLENASDSKDITYFGGAARYVLEKLLSNYPNLKILLITPMFRNRLNTGDGINSDDSPYRGFYMYQYADKIVEIGKQFHIPVLNLHDNSGVNKYTATTYLEDGLHPSLVGRQMLGSKIASGLLSSF